MKYLIFYSILFSALCFNCSDKPKKESEIKNSVDVFQKIDTSIIVNNAKTWISPLNAMLQDSFSTERKNYQITDQKFVATIKYVHDVCDSSLCGKLLDTYFSSVKSKDEEIYFDYSIYATVESTMVDYENFNKIIKYNTTFPLAADYCIEPKVLPDTVLIKSNVIISIKQEIGYNKEKIKRITSVINNYK